MKVLIIIHDAPYGNEKAYNALRQAMMVQKEHSEISLRIFLMADSVTCAIKDQITPNGYYNIERMLKSILCNRGEIKLCGTCLDARGLKDTLMLEGTQRSTMSEFTNWVLDSDKVISF
ncbi:MAG: hypothetical protein EHM58_09175 [Ignavibacteriae bacterium]|nr:MAG: hypothetical protein EHM58_09175 [Ignavibacteriota bacterium]